MSSSANAGGKKIACNLVEHINLASRSVLETALQTDDQVDKTIAFDLDLNLLMKDIPLSKTGNRSLSKYFAFSKNAKNQIDRALESTPSKPGSSLPYSSLSNWQPFVVEGDELDPVSIFTADNKSGVSEPFSKIIEQEILEMRTLQNSGADADDESGEGNTQIIAGVVPTWLDQKGVVIPGNLDTDGTPHKNFLHSFLSSSQLDELVRSSVELSLYCTPQPNKMVSGGEDTSEASVAEAHDSLNNRDDFGKVFPQPTLADERWTSFLKLREDDLWIFKLRLSIHDDGLSAGSPSSSRLYRFIFRQKDTLPSSVAMEHFGAVTADGGSPAYPAHYKFTVEAPSAGPARNEIEYTGSLTHLGVQLTQGSGTPPTQYLVDPNSMFHTGKKLASLGLHDGFLCALIPADQDACVNLTRPIFAVAQAAIKKVDEVGTITQLHPIRDLDAQVSRYVDHKRCLVMPMKEWNEKKNPAVVRDKLGQSSIKELFDDGEEYGKYPTCHVRVQCGSGAEFDLRFEADSEVGADPNSGDLTAVRLTGVKLTNGGSGYLPFSEQQKNDPDFYTFYLKGTNGEYMPHQVANGQASFHTFMMDNFKVDDNGEWDYTTPQAEVPENGIVNYPQSHQRIMAADESEMSVELRQGDSVCSFTSMSEAIQLPLFHNQDVQGKGTHAELNNSSFSVYSHTFQNNDQGRTKTFQPIQQNMASKLEIQYPPHRFLKDHSDDGKHAKVMSTLTDDIKCQYEKINAYVEVGGLSERGGNYHMIEEDGKKDLYEGDDSTEDIKSSYKGFKEYIFDTGSKSKPITNGTIPTAFQNCYINHRYMNSRRLVLKHQLTTVFNSIVPETTPKHPGTVALGPFTSNTNQEIGTSYVASASGMFSNAVGYVFDGDTTNSYHASEDTYDPITGLPLTSEKGSFTLLTNEERFYGAWIQLESTGATMDITAFRSFFKGLSGLEHPTGLALLTSQDGVAWTVVKEWAIENSTGDTFNEFQLDTRITTLYVRVVTTKVHTGRNRSASVEIEFYNQDGTTTYDINMTQGALCLPIEHIENTTKVNYCLIQSSESGNYEHYNPPNATKITLNTDTSVEDYYISAYQTEVLTAVTAIKYFETSSFGGESVIQLEDGYRFYSKPSIYEPGTYGTQHIFQMDQAGTSCTLDCWGFASRGIHFERLNAEAVRALSQAELEALPSVRVIDPQTSTQLAVRLVEVEKSASTVGIEFFMGYGMTVDVEKLRNYLYSKDNQTFNGNLFLDYTVQVEFSKPVQGGDNALQYSPPSDSENLVTVDTTGKTITLHIDVITINATLLHEQSDNHEITLGDVHRVLSYYMETITGFFEGVTITLPADRVLNNVADDTILSGGPGDTWFETAHTFSHGGAKVTLPCRYWESKQVELLKDACTAFEDGCRTKMIPQTSSKNRLGSQMTENSSFILGLQDYFTDAGAATTVAEFAFYGEIAVTAEDDKDSSDLSNGNGYLSLVLSDLNMLKLDESTTARLGEFLYANHTETYHGKRPIYDSNYASTFPLYGDSGISPFEEASRDVTHFNCPRDFVVRAYRHDDTSDGIDEHEIEYPRGYLESPDDTVSDMKSLPLVFDADQRMVPQGTFEQRVL